MQSNDDVVAMIALGITMRSAARQAIEVSHLADIDPKFLMVNIDGHFAMVATVIGLSPDFVTVLQDFHAVGYAVARTGYYYRESVLRRYGDKTEVPIDDLDTAVHLLMVPRMSPPWSELAFFSVIGMSEFERTENVVPDPVYGTLPARW